MIKGRGRAVLRGEVVCTTVQGTNKSGIEKEIVKHWCYYTGAVSY